MIYSTQGDGAADRRPKADMVGGTGTAAGPVLALTGVQKSFGGVQALRGASLTSVRGEVHALIGENGAGKSTLVKVLAGAVRPDGGQLLLNGEPVSLRTPADARQAGIVTVFQELSLIGDHTVATNLFYGIESHVSAGRINVRAQERVAESALVELGLGWIDPRRTIRSLSLAERQLVEIAKAFVRDPKVLVLDEATSALLPEQVGWLFDRVRAIAEDGGTVIFISHRLEEIQSLADRVTVFREGIDVGSGPIDEMPEGVLVELMLGRKVERFYPHRPDEPPSGPALCQLIDFGSPPRLRRVSLEIGVGEIVGVGGLQGQGQAELFLALYGVRHGTGEILLEGKPLRVRRPADALAAGIALVPEDRSTEGLCLSLGIRDNISLGNFDRISRFGFISTRKERELVAGVIDSMQVKMSRTTQEVSALSGGNQQKVLLGRVISRTPKLLLMFDATRGVDVGTKTEIYSLMRQECERGAGILFYSTDAAELANLSDRTIVLHDGAIRAELSGSELTEERIVAAAVGAGRDPR